jgi:hypothetical protein
MTVKTHEPAVAMATIGRTLPGRYDRLEAALTGQPIEVQQDFFRVIQAYNQLLTGARRRAREPWRR